MQAAVAQTTPMLPLSAIHAGKNPRTYFDPKEMEELTASIKAKGILQPILVRPVGDAYQIVAGERRFRAATAAGLPEIPVSIRDMTDDEAEAAALIENVQRANMSPSEEAEAAARVLGTCRNDRDEAARLLGWSREVLDKRLALNNLSEKSRTALNERKIKLGHAELLAAAPRDIQDKALDAILANGITVEACKEMLAKIARSMASAIFAKDDCAGCQHNSDNQSVLFGESVGRGSCTNGACYDKKTEEELVKRRDALVDEFPKVEIVRPGQQYTVIKLKVDGQKGVGEEQAKACRACASFGAVVSATPDKLGQTFKDLCFDTVCNSKKAAEYAKAVEEAEKQKAAEEAAAQPAATDAPEAAKATSDKAKVASTAKAGAKAPAKAAPKIKVQIQESTRLKEYRVEQWRKIAKAELVKQPQRNLVVLISLAVCSNINHVSSMKMADGLRKLSGSDVTSSFYDIGIALDLADKLDENGKKTMFLGLAATAMDGISEKNLCSVLKFLEVDMTVHWSLSDKFFELLTKSEIEVLAEEVGLKAALGDKFSKVMSGKKDEIIKALMKVDGFKYEGCVPKCMIYPS
ncbi:PRTRC system ParB family protein [Noviherbaspirillum galbum]|uniref:PRTRC system ParB family protein n=1 Tax=Noviherbaspirillum galbum TaxID=2709383 RepID=A0A6B3SL58_9BURK|nr:PRTRC system ParB family protein [Noviherbaspirillum galbum]NEX60105.1 PRTRC system ParB family protein [Noviherbaspirillum galbum]